MTALASPTVEEQRLMQAFDFTHEEPCPKCGCCLYRRFFEVTGCVRCYPDRRSGSYWQKITELYPDKRFTQQF